MQVERGWDALTTGERVKDARERQVMGNQREKTKRSTFRDDCRREELLSVRAGSPRPGGGAHKSSARGDQHQFFCCNFYFCFSNKVTGIAEDDQIRKALDKTRDVGGDYNLARAVDLLLGIVEWLHNAQ